MKFSGQKFSWTQNTWPRKDGYKEQETMINRYVGLHELKRTLCEECASGIFSGTLGGGSTGVRERNYEQ